MRYPVDRACPLTGEPAARVVAYAPASVVAASNPTYRENYPDILGVSPDDEFPFVESPAGFLYAGWTPPDDFLERVYEDVIDHSRTVTTTIAYRQTLLEFGAAFMRLILETKTNRPLHLLDFGCGYGALLNILGSRDIISVGYEPSAERAGTTTADGRFSVLTDPASMAEAGPFDLFVCTEVLEHVLDPRAVLRLFKANAAPGALLAVTVPQCEAADVSHAFGELEAHQRLSGVFNPWEHLNYFTASSLRALLSEEGFKVVQDYGAAEPMRQAGASVGRPASVKDRVRLGIAMARRSLARHPSTQLFCTSV